MKKEENQVFYYATSRCTQQPGCGFFINHQKLNMETKQGVSTRVQLDAETNEIVKRFQAMYYLETGESLTKEQAIIIIIKKNTK
jgi:hypothetical protein